MKPLQGKRIIVTRSKRQAGALVEALREQGATVLECPAIEIRDPEDLAPLERAAAEVEKYDLVIFTSVNGVERFFARRPGSIRGKTCAIGPATAAALKQRGLEADFVPRRYIAEGLLEALSKLPLQGCRVLIPRAAVARDLIPQELERRGAKVEVVEAYQTILPAGGGLNVEPADMIIFTSSSTVTNFAKLFPQGLPGVAAASIGPITTETAREAGWEVAVEAREYTIPGLVKAIAEFYGGK